MISIAAGLERRATLEPDREFCTILANGVVETITVGTLYAASCAYARAYRRRSLGAGDIVLIALRHGPHLFYSFIGAMLAGAVPSFMPFPSPKQDAAKYWRDHDALFRRIEPALIVTFDANVTAARDAIPGFAIETMLAGDDVIDGANQTGGGDAYPGLFAKAGDVACLQHSSGTTGLKKGVMLTHAAIARQVEAYAKSLGLTENDRIASWLPVYHDMGFIACFLMPLITGTPVVAMDPFEWVIRPAMLLDAIARFRATLCWQPNFAFSHIANTTKKTATFDLSSMRAFVNCSEPCKPAAFERFAERFSDCGVTMRQLHVCYAMAENVFAVSQTVLGMAAPVALIGADAFARGAIEAPAGLGDAKAVLSCGAPIEGVAIEIRDEAGSVLGENAVGEIAISSPFLFSGYYRQSDVTERRLRDGWYGSGDLGFVRNGELYLTGRVDDMLIVNGRNYYAHEIEDVVTRVAGVLPGRTVAIGIDERRSDAAAIVVLAEAADSNNIASIAAEIKRDVFDRMGLTLYAVTLLSRGTLIKTTSGKISRSENKRLYVERLAGRAGS